MVRTVVSGVRRFVRGRRWRGVFMELANGWPGVAVVVVAGVAMTIMWTHGFSSAGIRYGGTWLEVWGIVAVAWQVYGLRRQFAHPTLTQLVLEWVQRVIKAGTPQTISIDLPAADLQMRGDLQVQVRRRAPATIEERLEILEQRVKENEAQAYQLTSAVAAARASFENVQRTSERQTVARHVALQKQLEAVMVGDFHIDVIGLWLLAIGGLCANLSDEIATVIARL